MSLLDRYIHEVGRYLPPKNKGDIQAELRSSLVDSLEDRFGPDPAEADVAALLQEWGNPRQVAASYHPQGQYLVGPALFPVFSIVAWVVVAAVLGAQVLAWGVAFFVAGESFSVLETLSSLINSIPASLGWVLIVFMLLQRFGVQPELTAESWDPADLPEINTEQNIKRGEKIVSLVFSSLLLALVTLFPQWIGFVTAPGGTFYPNPVVQDNLVLIQISLVAVILFNVYLLWRGRWEFTSRLVEIGLNIFSIFVLFVLVQGHTMWLAARNSGGFFIMLESLADNMESSWELIGMQAFRLAFIVALIVNLIEVFVSIIQLVTSKLQITKLKGNLASKTE
jgi:hypothetical protein